MIKQHKNSTIDRYNIIINIAMLNFMYSER